MDTDAFHGTSRFVIRERLGEGGMGVDYRAFDRERATNVALKCLREVDSGAVIRLKREFRVAGDLLHPNLVELGELIEDGGHWFFETAPRSMKHGFDRYSCSSRREFTRCTARGWSTWTSSHATSSSPIPGAPSCSTSASRRPSRMHHWRTAPVRRRSGPAVHGARAVPRGAARTCGRLVPLRQGDALPAQRMPTALRGDQAGAARRLRQARDGFHRNSIYFCGYCARYCLGLGTPTAALEPPSPAPRSSRGRTP